MAIKPILFNTEMVRAILDGRKTCTRRVAKNVPDHTHRIEPVYENGRFQFDCFYSSYVAALDADADFCMPCFPPYQRGDILYVRETWGHPISLNSDKQYVFRADEIAEIGFKNDSHIWHPSIHMQKEAARIWLKVTDVRVKRLQDMTNDDALKEGAKGVRCDHACSGAYGCTDCMNTGWLEPPMVEFVQIWDSTIKKSDIDRYGWNANPWVWVIDFERCDKPSYSPSEGANCKEKTEKEKKEYERKFNSKQE